ncbi:uncharacterized protein GLRG_01171 [Colletotrichum graminicola M1.001]|uniref:Uncharacterized protein n=1 Tax=Colletotrichum graminicola (strain M1.001 / M2 / FGSC 10212) TaxID=645133 RepID=E3Q4L2_COLGM|nr:uncharacterized protein GLRG_01171 [Colletotrichum graminicola M1.001]EFQ26027.1 hypothetical protein GLRG_01171 [Colletotrichum graminicola M1.001]
MAYHLPFSEMYVQKGAPLSRYRGYDAEDSFLLPIFLAVADPRPRVVTMTPITSNRWRDAMARQREDGTTRHMPPMAADLCLRCSLLLILDDTTAERRREGEFGALAGLLVTVANNALADIKPTPQWEP